MDNEFTVASLFQGIADIFVSLGARLAIHFVADARIA